MEGRDFSAELFGAPEGRDFGDELFGPAPQESVFRQVADVPLGVAKGAVQGVRMIADAFGAGSDTSKVIKGAEDYLGGLMSAAAKKDQAEISRLMKDAEDKGVLEQVKAGFQAFATAPVDMLSQAFGTAVPVILATVGSSLLGGGAGVATGVSALTGAGMGAGVVKGSIYEATKQALIEAGAQPDEAEKRAQLAQEYGGKNLDQILLGTVLGGVAAVGPLEKGAAGALARRILGKVSGEEVAETTAEQAAKGALRRRAEAAGLEAVPEAVQAGQEQAAQNIALQREGFEVPTMRGVAGAMTMEGITGAGLGALAGGRRPTTPVEPEVEPPAPEAPPVEPPAPPRALEFKPEPYIQFPDGTVAKQSEVEAYIKTLPEDQQMAMRTKLLGLAPQEADKEPAPPTKALEFKPEPLIVYPDGSVAKRSEVDAYIQGLPEDEQIPARAKLFGMGEEATQVTPEMLRKLGIRGRAPIIQRLSGLELTDPRVQEELTSFAQQPFASPEVRGNIFGFLKTIKVEPAARTVAEATPPVSKSPPAPPVASPPVESPTLSVELAAPVVEAAAPPAQPVAPTKAEPTPPSPVEPSAGKVLPLTPALQGLGKGQLELYNFADAIEQAKKPITGYDYETVVDRKEIDDRVSTPESLMRDLTGNRNSLKNIDGKIRSGNRTSATYRTLIDAWVTTSQVQNRIDQSKRENPELWKAYEERQRKLQDLEVGDEVETFDGERAVIDAKFGQNWRIAFPKGGRGRLEGEKTLVPPSALRPVEEAKPKAEAPAAEAPAAPAKLAKAAKPRKAPGSIMGSPMLAGIFNQLGGLHTSLLSEFSTRFFTKSLDKNGRPIIRFRNPLVSGRGSLFNKNGKVDFTEIAEHLEQEGYLEPGSVERDYKEAGERAKDLIKRALNKEEVLTIQEQIEKDSREAQEAARQAQLEREEENRMIAAGEMELEPEFDWTDEEFRDNLGFDKQFEEDLDVYNLEPEDLRFLTDEELESELTDAEREQAQARRTRKAEEDARRKAAEGPAPGEDETFLTAQSEEELRERDKAIRQKEYEEKLKEAKARTAERKEREQRDVKARALETVDDFELGRTAEEQMSGMRDMFEEPAKPARVGTDAQIKSADEHAASIGGTVVYQDGDIALARGYSILTGDPVYSVINGNYRSKIDVRSYTGNLVTPEQKAELVKIRDDLEAKDKEAFDRKPSVKFDDGLAFSKDIPKEIKGVIQGWRELLGLKSNLYVTTVDDARANRDNFNGPHRAISSAGLSDNEAGSFRMLSNGDYYIAFRPSTSKTRMLEVVAHELGHMHEREVFKNADADTQQKIRDEHSKWLKSQTGQNAEQLIKSLRAKTTGKTTRIEKGMMADELRPYWKSFGEWYADQVSKWATTSEKPVSVVEKFFSRLGKALRNFYNKLTNQGYLPNETFVEYLEKAHQFPARLGPSEPTGPQAAQEEVKSQERATANFLRWFGDSKVVDENGEPMVMYHGTTRGGFSVFDRLKSLGWRGPSMDTVGSWFSNNPSDTGGAGLYAKAGGDGDTIYPVYLSIKNPKKYRSFNDFLRHMHRAAGRPMPESAPGRGSTEELRAELISEGYDGIEFEQTDNASLMNDIKDMQDAVERAKQEEFSVRRADRLPYTQKRERLEQTLKSMRKELDEFGSSTEFDQQRVFIAFEPTQIKSAIGNNGEYSLTDPDIRKSLGGARRTKLGFYSELENRIEQMGPKAAPAAQWKNMINALVQKGVKPDEIQWTGVTDWLDLQEGKVSKDDLINYLKQGGVQVEETVLRDSGDEIPFLDNAAKYSQYTLPGGENYREVLLTLPAGRDAAARKKRLAEIADEMRDGTTTPQRYEELWKERYQLASEYEADSSNNYRSSHWDQPNVLAHIRVNDRTDADGKRVLFVEELQSDWGQEGKKRGFRGNKKFTVRQDTSGVEALAGRWEVVDSDGNIEEGFGTEAEARRWADVEERGQGVPTAPFVTKTEGWLNLALKRVMIMAAEGGYDKVAFVNGEQSADRYDLSKQVERIDAKRKPNGMYELDFATKDGRDFNRDLNESELEANVGKEMAKKIVDATRETGKRVRFSGLDLKVGGEGMKTFYDTIVPTALKKLLPKVGGGAMTDVTIVTRDTGGFTTYDGEMELDEDGNVVDPTRFRRVFASDTTLQQPGFDITPAIREKVEGGLPLFSLEQTKGQRNNFFNELRQLLNKFGLKDVALKIEQDMQEAGTYARELIRIADRADNPIRTLRHEAIHALRELGFFTDAQWKSLSKMAKDKWIDQYLKQRNVDGKPLKAGEESRYDAYMREYDGDMEKITEEAVADAFADFDATKPPAGMLQTLLRRLRDFFQAMKSALTKVESVDQIFGKVEKGELKRGEKEEAGERKSVRDRATANFLRWFGDSKVVDEKGEPLVVYHGTRGDFTEFKPSRVGAMGPGIYFTTKPDVASGYSDVTTRKGQEQGGAQVIPVYLSVKNPFVIDNVNDSSKQLFNRIDPTGKLSDDEVIAKLIDQGYDAVYAKEDGEYVVFNPTQIKSAIGNNGDYSLTNADIRKSLGGIRAKAAKAKEDIIAAGREAGQKRKLDKGAFEGVNEDLFEKLKPVFAPRNVTIQDRIIGMRDNFWQRVAQGMADQFRTIKDYSYDAYMKARLSKSIDGGVEGLMFYGQVFNDGGALNIKKNTRGMFDILKPVGKELDRYLIYIALSRDAALPEGKRSIDPDLVARRGELIDGTLNGKPRKEVYEQVRKDMNLLNRSVLKVAVDSGLLNTTEGAIKDIEANENLTDEQKREKIAELRKNPIGYERFINDLNYIPFYKIMEDGDTDAVAKAVSASGLTSQYFSKALKGGEKPFGDLMENTLKNWSHILSASMKNQAAVAAMDAAVKAGVAVPNLKPQYDFVDGKVVFRKNGEVVGDGSIRADMTESEKGAVKIVVDGKNTYYNVSDPLLMDSITSIGFLGTQSKFLDVARDFKNLLQYGVTISPQFRVNNLIRDAVGAMGVSELRLNPVANVLQGVSLSDRNSPTYIAAMAGGGIFNFGTAYEGDQSKMIKRLLKMGVDRDHILDSDSKIATGLKYAWDKYQEWGNKAENANRLALYQQLRDKGMSHLEATFKARDLMDFSMQGSWPAFRVLTQVIPFLNARVQGLYKLGRDGISPTARVINNTLTGKPIEASDKQKAQQFSIVLMGVTLASALLYLTFKDDEEYKRRDDWDKDNFWWFRVPGMEFALRVPKPFEIGAFGTVVERTLEQILDSGAEGKEFGDALFRMLTNTFAINPIPQAFKPLVDIYANKDSFTGAPIESAGLERLSKQERMVDTTSPLAIALGKVSSLFPETFEISPVQADYLIKGYLGWLGGAIAATSTYATMPFKEGEYPDARWMDRLSLGLARELPGRGAKFVTAFYESNKEIAQAYADMRHYAAIGDSQKVQELLEEKGDKIRLAKFYDNVATQMANIRKQIRLTQNDKLMDGAAKKEAIDRMQDMIAMLAKQAEDIRKQQKLAK